jgi:dihydrodipicolinate synthase/N-acetylneuraminate lyase
MVRTESLATRDAALGLLRRGTVIPAHPLALDKNRAFDERHQRALTRYYVAAGAGGLAVGVHTTQFEIHEPRVGLYEPVLALAAETVDAALYDAPRPFVKVAGLVGATAQAVREAECARSIGYHTGLLSLAALADKSDAELITHCRAVAETIPLFGFYLQPAVGGRALGYDFWRAAAEIPGLVGIKIAPFNRYQTIDVVRAVAESGRDDIALYTGNDDSIVVDLVTPFRVGRAGSHRDQRIVGGLLGQWAVWTRRAVELHTSLRRADSLGAIDPEWLRLGASLTDANAAIFDARNAFEGCIAGIHEVLRRQGLMRGIWCLDPRQTLSPGQADEIDRVIRAYPTLTDDAFVASHLDEWLT